ncbi:MAG: lyase family protein, partial [Polyangiaceae bacterium]
LDVRRLAWDLSLFTSTEFGFVRLPGVFMTGSSIMPNKRNPDVVELLRAAYARGLGAQVEISSILGLPSGYQRDLQATKAPFVGATDHALGALALLPRLVRDLELVPERMRAAIDPDMFATDRAIELTASGVPFRDAYQKVARQKDADARTPEQSLEARVSPGACADLQLGELRARLTREREAP